MFSFYILLALIITAILYGLFEFSHHQKQIYGIPIRIHINGTRGKSSVTRLIGAGLRAGGISTITKVTGTYPRLILEDGEEVYVYRKAGANIIEQKSMIKFARKRNVQALVIECMALQPQYQWITENQMIHANIGVMTNVRLDHTDIMGHTLPEIAEAMGNTIPSHKIMFTAEDKITDVLQNLCDKRNCKLLFSDTDSVTPDDMNGFSYIEHRENVALALAVCGHLGVDRYTALQGMYEAIPDEGALRRDIIEVFSKQITFYNAFAANDPESSLMIWKKLRDEIGFDGTRIILLNTRQDRLDRARQLAEMVGQKLREELHYLLLVGQSTEVVEHMSVANGLSRSKIINLGWETAQAVFEKVLSVTKTESTVVAIGNMGGMGGEIVEYFNNRSINRND